MTAMEFVKTHYPTAQCERQKKKGIGGEVYYLIRIRGEFMYMASGKTKSNAWVNAKKKILESVEETK